MGHSGYEAVFDAVVTRLKKVLVARRPNRLSEFVGEQWGETHPELT